MQSVSLVWKECHLVATAVAASAPADSGHASRSFKEQSGPWNTHSTQVAAAVLQK